LNYDRVNQPLSRRGWNQTAANALADDPVLFAGGGQNNDFHVVYSRLPQDRLLLGQERPVVTQLLREHPYGLFIFSNQTQDHWHFINVKYDAEAEKRRLFRRITVGPEERLRTAAQQLSTIDIESIHPDLFGLPPLAIQQRHDEAFDVEKVTQEFYNRFVELFHELKDEIAGNNPTYRDEAPAEAQMILNRLLFLYFIQKKRWLDNNPHYLYERFQEYHKKDPAGHEFYSDFLLRLFQKLSNEQLDFKDLGDVPFLNGGLFEVEPFTSKHPFDLKISNRAFRDVFENLLERFNFTVREDTPLDIEVAIDPEMLGRIFENLILQLERDRDLRKMTGSYYTPRVIVRFMCQQSLKEYLTSECRIEPTKLKMLFELNPPDQLEDWQVDLLKDIVSIEETRTLRDLAKRVLVLDPAVGSGAFLVGMLHETLTLIKYMDVREHGPEYIARRNYDYELKRDIIENCLYGVDMLEQAVRICELRLWLSLVVDYDRQAGEEVPPLPNLSYQVKQGDSLIEKLFGQRVRLDTLTRTDKGRQLIDEIQQEKHSYFLTRNLNQKRQKELSILVKQCELAESLVKEKRQSIGTKQRLFGEMTAEEAIEREAIRQQTAELDKLASSAKNAKGKALAWLDGKLPRSAGDVNRLRQELGMSFVWHLDFAEVFKTKGGFDITIQNPPYLNIRTLTTALDISDKAALEKYYRAARRGYDLYVLFVELSLLLTRSGGTFCLIMPNKIQVSGYAESIREILIKETELRHLVDVSSVRVFKESSVYPNILLGVNKRPDDPEVEIGTGFTEAEQIYSEKHYFRTNQRSFLANPGYILHITKSDINDLLERITKGTEQLGTVCNLHAGTTGFSASNVSNCLCEGPARRGKSLPFIVTGNIDPYIITPGDVLYMKQKYDNPFLRHEARYITEGKWALFSSPKIVIGGMTKIIEAAYDPIGCALGVNVYAATDFGLDYRYILALLNSSLMTFIFKSMFQAKHLAGGYLAINKGQLSKLPIKKPPQRLEEEIISLTNQILQCIDRVRTQPSRELMGSINKIKLQLDMAVYDLYGLSGADIELTRQSS
jgi:hypothetical protein